MDALAHRIPEAATRLGIGRTKLLEEVAAGHLKVVRVGRRVLVTEDELRRYVAGLEAARSR
jgi:excisionase family DNA binding protein